jgi:hypothetical protein
MPIVASRHAYCGSATPLDEEQIDSCLHEDGEVDDPAATHVVVRVATVIQNFCIRTACFF